MAVPTPRDSIRPLCVDLDGTLLKTDLFAESFLRALSKAPITAVRAVARVLCGDRAGAKRLLAGVVSFPVEHLPYRSEVLEEIARGRAAGRRIVLATAADRGLADRVAAHLGVFDEVLASDGVENLKRERKASALVERFGPGGFDYIGDAVADLPVWQVAHTSLVAGASAPLLAHLRNHGISPRVVGHRKPWLPQIFRACRVHQWVKNILVFVPLVASHSWSDPERLVEALQMFFAFGFTASAVYLCNDLLDLDADRAHPHKRRRPFASGEFHVAFGLAGVPLLLALAVLCTFQLPEPSRWLLAGYFALSSAYSTILKRVAVLDVVSLASLYLLRIEGGGLATGILPSFWLTAFAAGVFLSLGCLKRIAELRLYASQGISPSNRRPYRAHHIGILQLVCAASGMIAVATLGFYPQSENAQSLYTQPIWLYAMPIVFAAWLARIWRQMIRKSHIDDPVFLAISDPLSYLALLLMIAAALLAS